MHKFLILFALLSFVSAHAQDIKFYQGQTYKVEQLNQCEQDLINIQTQLDRVEELTYLSGGCVEISKDFVQIKFEYMASVTQRIESFQVYMQPNQKCGDIDSLAIANKVEAAGNIFIASYCEHRRLKIDYIDLTYSMIRDLKIDTSFNDREACEKFVTKQTKEVESRVAGVIFVIKKCRAVRTISQNQAYYVPLAYYISNFKHRVQIMQGQSYERVCSTNSVQVEANMQKAGLKLLSSFCRNTRGMLNNEQVSENFIYLMPQEVYQLERYESRVSTDRVACEQNIEKVEEAFINLKYKLIYSYCEKNKDSYKAIINYIK